MAEPRLSQALLAALTDARSSRRYERLVELLPYAAMIGIEITGEPEHPLFTLPPKPSNTGNPNLPALHGGVIGGFMETSAILATLLAAESDAVPKVVNLSLEYLRPGRLVATYARCDVVRQGSRILNLGIRCYQTDPETPIALGRVHFLLVGDNAGSGK